MYLAISMSITRKLAKRISDYERQDSLGSTFRAKRTAPLLRMIERAAALHGEVRIIDVGGTRAYWGIVPRGFLEDRAVTVTIVNLPGTIPAGRFGPFEFVEGDGCNLSMFGDRTFHIAHSNSVLEHVGDPTRMRAFATEISRLAGAYFVQTPNLWFPVEPHCMTPFFHWLPMPARLWLVSHFQLGHWTQARSAAEARRIVDSARLLSRRQFNDLFKDARIVTERLAGFAKSFIAIRE
jgi:hypothetical protein